MCSLGVGEANVAAGEVGPNECMCGDSRSREVAPIADGAKGVLCGSLQL